MPEKQYTFRKEERLCNRTFISQLFNREETFRISEFPLIISWKAVQFESPYPAQVLFSVSRKYSKKAVDRNKIKRQLRELYRHSKHRIYQVLNEKNTNAVILISYNTNSEIEFPELIKKYDLLIEKFIKSIG
jgi:ribonuclease P protein component